MITRYSTENGSVYAIDDVQRTWRREDSTEMSGMLRSQGDPYREACCLGRGYPLVITGDPLDPLADVRVITTSPVITIEEEPG